MRNYAVKVEIDEEERSPRHNVYPGKSHWNLAVGQIPNVSRGEND